MATKKATRPKATQTSKSSTKSKPQPVQTEQAIAATPSFVQQEAPHATAQPATPTPTHTNTWAIVGFICAFLFPLLGLIFSIIGLHQIKASGEKGHGLALAGIILSCVFMVLTIMFIFMIFALRSAMV